MTNQLPRSTVPERDALRTYLKDKQFTHFISLAPNDPMISPTRARALLREWDARTNRALLGKRWRSKPDERMNWIAFLESPRDNPHWHLLVQLLEGQEQAYEASRGETFSSRARVIWRGLKASGTVDIQLIDNAFVTTYVTKQLGNPEALGHFVIFREFFEL